MGKKIDRLTSVILLTIAIFVLCIRLCGSIPAACAFSFIAAMLFHQIQRRSSRRGRMSASSARRLLNSWAWESEDVVRAKVTALLRPEEAALPLVCILRPQGFAISKSDVFSNWKAHAGQQRMIIAGTCRADGSAIAFAEPLKNPSVLLLDAGKLLPRIRKSGLQPPNERSIRETTAALCAAIAGLPGRCSWTRTALTGLIAFSLYLLHGNPLSLTLALALLFLSGVSFRSRRT